MIRKRQLVRFDLENKDHVEYFKQFMVAKAWKGGCPFEVEFPWINVPDMIKDKIIKHTLKI